MLTQQIDLDTIKSPVKADLTALDDMIHRQLASRIELIRDVSLHIMDSGGKRMRPLMTILCAKAVGYQGEQHIALASIIELIHTATLLHDDVVDDASLRRGKTSANTVWGNQPSILVGDFLYSRAFSMIVNLNNMAILNVLSNATTDIAEGEIQQLINCNDAKVTESDYLNVIQGKTATLFAAAAESAGLLGGASETQRDALKNYALNMGLAFQLIDDALDYSATTDVLGKKVGADLSEGKPTLPLIHALKHGNAEQRSIIKEAIQFAKTDEITKIQAAILETNGIGYTHDVAKRYIKKASAYLAELPETPYREALIDLAEFTQRRTH